MQTRYLCTLVGALVLLVSAARLTFATPPPGYTTADIGDPRAQGSTDVDGSGAWTMQASGNDIWGPFDSFHYAYQKVKGDATITARFLSMDPVGASEWTKVGLMVRESDANNAPNAYMDMTSGHGIQFQIREVANENTKYDPLPPNVFDSPNLEGPSQVWMRVQRSGNDVTGYHSQDGQVWKLGTWDLTIPTLQDEALIGIAATSHVDGSLVTAKLDHVGTTPGAALVHGIKSCGGDRSVSIEWKPVKDAQSYNLYRAPAGTIDLSRFAKLNDQVVTGTTYTDGSADLVNNQTYAYLIAPVLKGADGNPVEGAMVAFQAGPVLLNPPPGFTSTSINEDALSLLPCTSGLGAIFDPASGVITLHGSGRDIWGAADEFNFTHAEVEGDFVVTVKALTKPSYTHAWAKAGLMIREGLDAGARDAYFILTARNGLGLEWRPEKDNGATWSNINAIDPDALTTPIWSRMTRKGDNIVAEYSSDGSTWQGGDADQNKVSLSGLAKKVNVGLAITAHDVGVISEAKFQGLEIRKL